MALLRCTPRGRSRCRSVGSARVFPEPVPVAPPGSRNWERVNSTIDAITAKRSPRSVHREAITANRSPRCDHCELGSVSGRSRAPAGGRSLDDALLLESFERLTEEEVLDAELAAQRDTGEGIRGGAEETQKSIRE